MWVAALLLLSTLLSAACSTDENLPGTDPSPSTDTPSIPTSTSANERPSNTRTPPTPTPTTADPVTPPPPIPKIATEPAFPSLPARTFGERPVFLTYPPDDSNRVVVVEQNGLVHIFENAPTVAEVTTYLDIGNRISRDGNEEGLLGLAFHPDYVSNGKFYVYYSAARPRRSVVSSFTVSSDPDRADIDSESVLLEIPEPYSNHNGGSIVFGPDDYLYIGIGDGGSRFDPHQNGQNPKTVLGTIIRIDVDTPAEGMQYGIPSDNPFAASPNGERPEIWAYGLRNPWRFSFDRETGELWVGDVGQNAWEEIDLVERGGNYGWNTLEASHCFRPSTGCNSTGTVLPIAEYGRSSGCSVTGGYVTRGPSLPELNGVYVYADFCTGLIWGLRPDGQQPVESALIGTANGQVSSFGEDADGNVYLLMFGGKVHRITPSE